MIEYKNLVTGGNDVRVSRRLTDAHGSSDLLGDHDATEVVDPTNNSRSFHLYKNLLALQIFLLISAKQGDLY